MLRGSVSLMFPDVKKYPTDFIMWVLGLHAKYDNFEYFLDKESTDFIDTATLKEGLEKVTTLNASTCVAVDFGVKSGYTKEKMLDYFTVTEAAYSSHPYHTNKRKE